MLFTQLFMWAALKGKTKALDWKGNSDFSVSLYQMQWFTHMQWFRDAGKAKDSSKVLGLN